MNIDLEMKIRNELEMKNELKMNSKNELEMKNIVEMNSRYGKSIQSVYILLLIKKQLQADCKISITKQKHGCTVDVEYYQKGKPAPIKRIGVYASTEKQARRFKRLLELKGDLI